MNYNALKTATPLFITHHSPPGAWSSLTFGASGKGMGIDSGKSVVEYNAELLALYTEGDELLALPFTSGSGAADAEAASITKNKGGGILDCLKYITPERLLLPCTDSFRAGRMELCAFTPNAMPEPGFDFHDKATGRRFFCPSVLLEFTVDNTGSSEPRRGFLGLRYTGLGRIRMLEEDGLCGIALANGFALAALPEKGITLLRNFAVAPYILSGGQMRHNSGAEGGIMFEIAPGEKRKLTVAAGFYSFGTATSGLKTSYYYTTLFSSVEEVCAYALEHSAQTVEFCEKKNREIVSRAPDQKRLELLAQTEKNYYSVSRLTTDGEKLYFSICEGQYLWQNTFDLAADHMYYELEYAPFASDNIIRQMLERYCYHDKVRFPGESGYHSGGISFCHDMGSYISYSPAGYSAYERVASPDDYTHMTTEQLLNGILYFTGWAKRVSAAPLPIPEEELVEELLDSLDNRDYYIPEKRNGILKAESERVGECGREGTTYDSMSPSLAASRGNIYIAVKTFASELLLCGICREKGWDALAKRAEKRARMTAESLESFWLESQGRMLANIYLCDEANPGAAVLCAAESLTAVEYFGYGDLLAEYPRLCELLKKHTITCLEKGVCRAENGGLTLTSETDTAWFSKLILTLYAAEKLLGVDVDKYAPGVWEQFMKWAQIASRERSISDQIRVCGKNGEPEVIGGSYCSRAVCCAILLAKKRK